MYENGMMDLLAGEERIDQKREMEVCIEIVAGWFAALQAWFVCSYVMYFWICLYCTHVRYTMYKV